MSGEQLDFLRTCALLHDIGKPECWANRKAWSEHIHFTFKILKATLGEDYATTAMRHHMGISYSTENHPQTDSERIICLADNLSSGADRPEEPVHGSPLPSPPIALTHVLSKGKAIEKIDAPGLSYAIQEMMPRLKEAKAILDKNRREGYLKLFRTLNESRLKKIPADTRSPINDVSLWDHLKLTAAFATCMWLDGGYKGNNLDQYEFALVCGDADKISKFIGLSLRLPDLNARSEMIKQATEKAGACIVQSLGPECLLFAGGGGLLAVAPVCRAEEISQEVKRSFETETRGLVTFTVNCLTCCGSRMQKDFGSFWKEAQWQMRLKKTERLAEIFASLPENVEVCDVCHIRPATNADTGKTLTYNASSRPERLCETCWQLRLQGKGARLDDLKDKANLVALVKADGDDIGKVLGGDRLTVFDKVSTPSRLSGISRQIHEVCEKRLNDIVEKARGRCLIAGGDDVLAIVPGEQALGIARKMAFEFKNAMVEACTMSSGVAIFRYDLPIYTGLEAADCLLRVAKESKSKDSVAFAFIGGVGLTKEDINNCKHGPRKWSELGEILSLANFMAESGAASTQIRKIAEANKKDPVYAEVLIKSLMGKDRVGKGLSWDQGVNLLSHVESGILLDAFAVYNAFKK